MKFAERSAAYRESTMPTLQAESLSSLYEQDETAWLETMAGLVARKQYADLDHKNLSEFLFDMAKRDRREVHSRLVILMCHLLKWEQQPEKQTGSWRGTIREQRRELRLLLDSKTLKNHAEAILADAYADARKQAADETEMKLSRFPNECRWDVDDLLSD
jgi:hypothetical protein